MERMRNGQLRIWFLQDLASNAVMMRENIRTYKYIYTEEDQSNLWYNTVSASRRQCNFKECDCGPCYVTITHDTDNAALPRLFPLLA